MPHQFFYIESLSPLYEAVQTAGLFADSKLFVDCIPKYDAATIVAHYNNEKGNASFSLKDFVQQHFEVPVTPESHYSSANKTITEHLAALWDELKRTPDHEGGTLIPMPNEYIVPGGRFREIYYWDSYFTMLGLQVSQRTDLIEHMLDNFAYLINEVGFIPNGNRTYYLGRSQPPFFALMVQLLAEEKGEPVFKKYLPALEKEYAFWMQGAALLSATHPANEHTVLSGTDILNRYWDSKPQPRPEAYEEDMHIAAAAKNEPGKTFTHIRAAAESGWDFSSRWFGDHKNMHTIQTSDLVPVDLNCLLLFMEQLLMQIHEQQNNQERATAMKAAMEKRRLAIQQYCWNEKEGCFFDYNFVTGKQEIHFNLSTVFPLFFTMATAEQSKRIASLLEEKFLQAGGLITTLYNTGQQWDAPNGWAPLQWMAYKGLMNYGHITLAQSVKQRWMQNCEKVFAATGKMMEKYNVMDTSTNAGGGEYPNQDGFGWTNGVYLKMQRE
ncbi:MAG: alpha,alpha-trehalase TreF [Bacteroidetes bacterium]|nr:alpha,alpha-trehalase TreF [Bacteroidota bacterium]